MKQFASSHDSDSTNKNNSTPISNRQQHIYVHLRGTELQSTNGYATEHICVYPCAYPDIRIVIVIPAIVTMTRRFLMQSRMK